MGDNFDDSAGSVLDEPGWGGGGATIDTSGDFMHLPAGAARRAAKERALKRYNKWRIAQAVREGWTPEQHAAEEARISAQIAEWEARRHAA